MSIKKSKGSIFDPGLCRCCGSMKKCRLLTEEYEFSGQKEVYSDLMMDCFNLLLSYLDSKPSERLICATCVVRLREADAFRCQVLRCEEAFQQMRMFDVGKDNEDPKGSEKIEVTVVKDEPPELDLMSNGSAAEDMLCRSDPEDAAADSTAQLKLELANEDSLSNDDMPLIRSLTRLRATASIGKPSVKQKIQDGRAVVKKLTKSRGLPVKNSTPMVKLQQINRERDQTYITESNLLTIIEYSHVCPFKCRHNHLICYYCGHLCKSPDELREHTSNTHSPKKFKLTERKKMIKVDISRIDCRLCSETIDNLDVFKLHVQRAHNKKYYFNQKDYILPFRLTSDELKCVLCEQKFAYFHALNKHMNVHFSNYVCETCGLGFVDNCRFLMHQQRHDSGDFPCETCGKMFKAEYNRELHVDRVHNKRGRVYCPKCDVRLMSYPQKLKHLVEVHGEQPLSFSCNLCDKVCMTRRMLTIHQRKDHLKDYRYECKYCGQKFFTRFALNNHTPTHTGERNFKCKVCEKTYPRLKTLKDHMRIHLNDRRYRCHICGQAFIQNCSLKGHMKSQHPEYG